MHLKQPRTMDTSRVGSKHVEILANMIQVGRN